MCVVLRKRYRLGFRVYDLGDTGQRVPGSGVQFGVRPFRV